MWVVEGETEIQQTVEQAPFLPLGPSPTYSVTPQLPALPCPGEHLVKNEERLRNLQAMFKRSNIRITGVPEGEEEEQKIQNLFEQIMEKFPNLAKEIDFQEVQEAQRVPKKLDPSRNTPRHIIITLPKMKQKERILEAAREQNIVTYKGVPIRLSADFSKETLQARRGWQEVFQVMKGKDLHPR